MWAFYICALLLLFFGIYIGFILGSSWGERAVTAADYWKMNAVAILAAVLAGFVLAGVPLLYGAIVGVLAGCIAGLKMSFGESSGPWRWLDRFMNVNRSHRETAEKGTGEERRRRRRAGERGPDLISVAPDRPSSEAERGGADAARGRARKNGTTKDAR